MLIFILSYNVLPSDRHLEQVERCLLEAKLSINVSVLEGG